MSIFIIIAVLVVIIVMVLIVAFARKASNSSSGTSTSNNRKQTLSAEQQDSLRQANSQLVNIRMTLSRLKDPEISRTGIEACSSIEKVLQTLKEKPEKIQTTRQLFNYYLPTLEKVISKYQRIEDSKVENEQMPGKLKNYLTDVRDAMDNLYEGLYDNDKLNVSVDMEAMTIAIKRDGLLDEEDFKALSGASAGVAAQEATGAAVQNVTGAAAGASAGANVPSSAQSAAGAMAQEIATAGTAEAAAQSSAKEAAGAAAQNAAGAAAQNAAGTSAQNAAGAAAGASAGAAAQEAVEQL